MCLIWSKSTVCITKKAGNVLDLVKINHLHYKKAGNVLDLVKINRLHYKKAGNVLDLVKMHKEMLEWFI